MQLTLFILKTEAAHASKTVIQISQGTWCHILAESSLQSHCCENPYLTQKVSIYRGICFLQVFEPRINIFNGNKAETNADHCATNRNVAGSIPDGVTWHNPFGRTMALGSTQPLTEMCTRYISWGVKAAGA
jgi:hypothetical protein